ncbi:unnamed protein product [Blepharisma stoltei]|uniref:Uncharacterized protein n=1 Tax=Blepharisma stoltei TaxID=1481888 RepID=A0AAU9IX42_9CILI|nr:unnamed protein product [Blepharisma stoltei]
MIEKGTNDRSMTVLDAQASKFDIDGNVIRYPVGKIKPASTQILFIKSPLVYPNRTTIKPDDLRNQDSECPFPDSEAKTFIKGKVLVFCICFAIALISIILTYLYEKNDGISL